MNKHDYDNIRFAMTLRDEELWDNACAREQDGKDTLVELAETM